MSDINGLELFKKLSLDECIRIILSNITKSQDISAALKEGEIDEYLQKDETDSLEKLEFIIKKYI